MENIIFFNFTHQQEQHYQGQMQDCCNIQDGALCDKFNGFQLLTIITKCSILDVVAVLDPPLTFIFRLPKIRLTEIFSKYSKVSLPCHKNVQAENTKDIELKIKSLFCSFFSFIDWVCGLWKFFLLIMLLDCWKISLKIIIQPYLCTVRM